MSSEFFERVFDRINKIDAGCLKDQLKRLSGELSMLETVFRSIQEGVMVIGASDRLVYANGAAEHLLAFSAEKLRGKPMSKYFGDIDWNPLAGVDWSQSGDAAWSHLLTREIEITYPKRRILSFYAVPLPDGGEAEEPSALVILRDVTRERDQEASALEDERLDAVKTLAASGIGGFRRILGHVEAHAPLRRTVSIEDVGNVAAFLCSDLASGVTGEVTYVDAGYNIVSMTGLEEPAGDAAAE